MDARLWLCRISGTVVEGGIHNWPDVRMDGSRKLQAEAGWRDPEAWVFGEKQLGQVARGAMMRVWIRVDSEGSRNSWAQDILGT